MDAYQQDELEELVTRLNLDSSTYHTPPDWSSTSLLPQSAHDARLFQPTFLSSSPPPAPQFLESSNASPSAPNVAGTSLSASALPRPLAVLSSSSPNVVRRTARFDDTSLLVSRRSSTMQQVEKDADDPTTPVDRGAGLERRESTALTTLSRLFAAQAVTSPSSSRNASNNRVSSMNTYMRSLNVDPTSLSHHLYTRGLLNGRHSDITVIAFGHRYALHRLILDRSPFFATALSEPWMESTQKEIALHPEDIDPGISQPAFELALKRLYGCNTEHEEDVEALGLFATGCWLEMQDLVDASVESLLRQMAPRTIASMVKLVTSNYYGKAGERILASAKAMLCRDGWEMPLRYWDGISGEIVREIVGGDGFFVEGEWDRWVLAKRLLDRRLKAQATVAGISKSRAPDTLRLMAIRFDTVYRKNVITATRETPDSHHRWLALYTHPDIEPLLVLMDEGIHYMHLTFEQLQYIRQARDFLGLPVMPENVINNALWMSMELRQKVVNAREADLELGLSEDAEEQVVSNSPDVNLGGHFDTGSAESGTAQKGKRKLVETTVDDPEEEMASGSWDGNGRPRKFWIPSSDCSVVMGGNVEPVLSTPASSQRQPSSRMSASLQPEDVQWATDFAASALDRPSTPARPGSAAGGSRPPTYSYFPPFRFAAEFPNPRLLKEKKRVYSRTVFYAGSFWNIYIQKVKSTKNPQLGVYLHRAKERETEEGVGSTSGMAHASVDERIGQLERDILLRNQQRARREINDDGNPDAADDADLSGGDLDMALVDGSPPSLSRHDLLRRRQRRVSHADALTAPVSRSIPDPHPPSGESDDPSLTNFIKSERKRAQVPTLPAYLDARPTIKTYFKIYSPSKAGRMLSVYESAPDNFNFSQSWGWKSSTLMLEDGISGEEEGLEDAKDLRDGVRRDGKLRFMMVIGNV